MASNGRRVRHRGPRVCVQRPEHELARDPRRERTNVVVGRNLRGEAHDAPKVPRAPNRALLRGVRSEVRSERAPTGEPDTPDGIRPTPRFFTQHPGRVRRHPLRKVVRK